MIQYLLINDTYRVLSASRSLSTADNWDIPYRGTVLSVHHDWGTYGVGDQVPRNVVANTHIATDGN